MENSNELTVQTEQEAQKMNTVIVSSGEVKQTDIMLPKNFKWDLLETAEKSTNVCASYFEFDVEGQKIRCMYRGQDFVNMPSRLNVGQYDLVMCAFCESETGIFSIACTQLVKDLEKFIAPGTFIEIEYKGREETKKGNMMKKFAISKLSF